MHVIDGLDVELEATLRDVLAPGEIVRWSGRPDPSVMFTFADVYLVPFSFMWAGFALFWIVAVQMSGAPLFFRLWGLPFLVAGGYILVGRFFVKRRMKGRTRYVVTDRRAILVRGRTTTSWALPSPRLDIRGTRSGRHVSVTFARTGASFLAGGVPANTGLEWLPGARVDGMGFYDVPDDGALRAALRPEVPPPWPTPTAQPPPPTWPPSRS